MLEIICVFQGTLLGIVKMALLFLVVAMVFLYTVVVLPEKLA
jgi:hypothetical protein